MPKRKVLQTVILHRESGRVVPAIGEIFDFTQDELSVLNRLNPEALGRPVQEVDVENQEAALKAAAQAEQEAIEAAALKAAAQAEAEKAPAGKGKKGNASASEDEV